MEHTFFFFFFCPWSIHLLNIRTFATSSSPGIPREFTRSHDSTHTPNSYYYYRHIYTSNMSSGQLCSTKPILTSASIFYSHHHSTITTHDPLVTIIIIIRTALDTFGGTPLCPGCIVHTHIQYKLIISKWLKMIPGKYHSRLTFA